VTEAAFDQLLRRLSEADVEFVLIGGLAVNAWGVVRGTNDVDIVVPQISRTSSGLQR
jgi:predicted nucleotidyltransferase